MRRPRLALNGIVTAALLCLATGCGHGGGGGGGGGTTGPGELGSLVGNADATFGNNGVVTSDFGIGQYDAGRDIAAGPAGVLYVTGSVAAQPGLPQGYSMAIWSYNAFDGSVNTAFGGGGRVLSPFPVSAQEDKNEGNAVAVAGDGRVYVAGYSRGNADDMTIWSYEPNGTLNTGFGNGNGYIRHDSAAGGGGNDRAEGIAFGPDGNLYVAGWSIKPGMDPADTDFIVWSYGTNGLLNTTFGIKTLDGGAGGPDEALDLFVAPDGTVYAVGYVTPAATMRKNLAVVSYRSDGSLNTDFAGTGVVTQEYANGATVGNAIALGPNGRIYIAGAGKVGPDDVLLVWCYNADGTPKAAFGGGDGVAEWILPGKSLFGFDLHVDSNGYVLVSGQYSDFAVFPPESLALVMFDSAGNVAQGNLGPDGYIVDDRGAQGPGLLFQDGEAFVTGPTKGPLQAPLSDMFLWNVK